MLRAMSLTYFHVPLDKTSSAPDALVVVENDTVVYLSLGRWHLLVATMRHDFSRLKLSPRPQKSGPRELVALVQNHLRNPSDTSRQKIPTRYLFGTDFQQRVWRHLESVPCGNTTTYSAVAAALGMESALARAVAGAVAANRLAVLVPCHRVVARDGLMAGFRWGVEVKRELLARERAAKGRKVGIEENRLKSMESAEKVGEVLQLA